MNIFNKVTLHSLKKNKTRTIVTIIGIMLSAAMICAVTTFVSSMQNYALDVAIYSDGDWHAKIDATSEVFEDISNDSRVSDATYCQSVGYAKIDSANKYKPYLYVVEGEQTDYFNTMSVRLVSGKLPENSSEIILPDQLLSDGKVSYKEGDTITLDIGDRVSYGLRLDQSNPYFYYFEDEEVFNEEELVDTQKRTYTVVGTYENPEFDGYYTPGYTALTVADEGIAEGSSADIYVKMNKPSEVYDFVEELGCTAEYNTNVLLYSGVSSHDSFSVVLISFAAIVIALIIFGSVSLIYNAFSISVSERTKQFGLLSSIGATKKQLRKMVIFEALAVSAVGIPLGILVGIGGIGITLLLIGYKFSSMMGSSIDLSMRICVTWESVVIAVLIALVTVLISVWIPSVRATRISAIEAIRQSADIKAKNKQVKTSKLTYKLFGLPGVLASKNSKRNRKKYRATVISLFMSIVLFVSASAFTGYLVDSVTETQSADEYDLVYITYDFQLNGKSLDEVLELFMSDEFVTGGVYTKNYNFEGYASKEYLTNQMIEYNDTEGAAESESREINENGEYRLYGDLCFVDDAEFKRLLDKYNLNEADYFNPDEPLALVYDTYTFFDYDKEKYVTLDILKGDECEIKCKDIKYIEGYTRVDIESDENENLILTYQNDDNPEDVFKVPYDESCVEYTLKSGKVIEDAPMFLGNSTALYMIYPVSMMENVLPQKPSDQYADYYFYLTSDNHTASYKNIKGILIENGLSGDFMDYAEDVETTRNLVNIIQVFAYGFVVLISLIAVANVFNTISTNIGLRRREFAMLKSVGMTKKGFNKMMSFECLLYGAKALVFGLPVSIIVTYLIYRAINNGFETGFYLPWAAIGIAVLSVFLVVFITMMYAMSKIKKDNPIDALKNENL